MSTNVVAIDMTDLDITVTANVGGATKTITVRDETGAVIPLGAGPFDGEVLASRSATIGSGTPLMCPVTTDGTDGKFNLVIPAALTVGTHYLYLDLITATAASIGVSGPLTITEF